MANDGRVICFVDGGDHDSGYGNPHPRQNLSDYPGSRSHWRPGMWYFDMWQYMLLYFNAISYSLCYVCDSIA